MSKLPPIPLWPAFFPSAPVVPKLYYDALSPEQRIKKLCEELHRLCDYANVLGLNLNIDREAINELEAQFQKFIEGGFSEYYEAEIARWIDEHFADIISDGMKQVYFGLTSDGYFCAYVPDSWSEITFDTGVVYGRSDYGRLILKFEADPDAHGVIDNTYTNYTLSERALVVARLIADLEVTARRGDKTYETLFTNMSEEVPDYANI